MEFNDYVVLVTGSSRGLGNAFANLLADAGATVVLNSTGITNAGDEAAASINAKGGHAVHIPGKVEDAPSLVQQVTDQFGKINAIVHNAGIVQDKTLRKMSNDQWDAVLNVHLKSAFQLSQAAWPSFADNGGGRLVFLSSASGLYGNFGQGNYAAAKAGMYGLCRSIALEGAAENICCNCVAPFGATEMNSGNMDEAFKAQIKTEYVAPLIGYLCHPDCSESGSLFEASGGSFKKVRWERTRGLRLDRNKPMTIDDIAKGWAQVTDFSVSEHPTDMRSSLQGMYAPE